MTIQSVSRSRKGKLGGRSTALESPAASGIQVIARTAAILRILGEHPRGLSLGEIAKRAGLPRSTVQRIIGALEAERFVTPAGPSGGTRLGPEMGRILSRLHVDVEEVAQPHLERLSRETGETVVLSHLTGRESRFVAMVVSDQEVRIVPNTLDTYPLHATSTGKVLLADMTEEVIRQILGERLERLTPFTRSSYPALLKDIREVHRTGFAYAREEHSIGLCSIACGLNTHMGRYALSVLIPTYRYDAQMAPVRKALAACKAAIEQSKGSQAAG